jgi:hypothetical protein
MSLMTWTLAGMCECSSVVATVHARLLLRRLR